MVGSDIDFMSHNKFNMSNEPQDLVRGSSSHTAQREKHRVEIERAIDQNNDKQEQMKVMEMEY